jgi:hypothetical protein
MGEFRCLSKTISEVTSRVLCSYVLEYDPFVLNKISYMEVLTPILSLKIESDNLAHITSKKKKKAEGG